MFCAFTKMRYFLFLPQNCSRKKSVNKLQDVYFIKWSLQKSGLFYFFSLVNCWSQEKNRSITVENRQYSFFLVLGNYAIYNTIFELFQTKHHGRLNQKEKKGQSREIKTVGHLKKKQKRAFAVIVFNELKSVPRGFEEAFCPLT